MNTIELIKKGLIDIEIGEIFQHSLSPKPDSFDYGRVEGMLLGVAIGDALGAPSEAMLPSARAKKYGEITHYTNRKRRLNKKQKEVIVRTKNPDHYIGAPTDDTQMTFWGLEQLIKDKGLIPENLGQVFYSNGPMTYPGRSIQRAIKKMKQGLPWYECSDPSAGNGALMRISPYLIPHLRSGGTKIWEDVVSAAVVTHNDSSSTAACLAFTAMLWELMDMDKAPEPSWWLNKYLEVTKDLEGDQVYKNTAVIIPSYEGPMSTYIESHVTRAMKENLSVLEASNQWYSSAYLMETIPTVLYILAKHGHKPEEAVLRAVNDTKDNDTIASIVGAAVGALYGKSAFHRSWISDLPGRLKEDDDGIIFKLIENSKRTFWLEDLSSHV